MPSYQGDPAPAAPSGRDAPARLGRYELIGHLATGGMAEIHLARLAGEAGFEKIVVVKRLLPELVASPAYVAMFLDEGKLVARLDHPNVCEVHELGRDGAEYYLAMPYLDGVSVHELIARPRDPARLAELRVAAGVIAQACAGLHHAHELRDADGAPAGLVHRDVSPSNLFVTAAGVVKVLDFGIAKVRGAAETELGTIKGKQQYMAPEQLLGEPLDRRCDVFAIGIVLYELATHQRLFKRASDYLAARAVLEEPIPRADAVDPAVPAALADVIAKALARDPAGRFADARQLALALEAALEPHGGLAGAREIADAVTSADELTAQRTRQARVLGEARVRPASTEVTTERREGPTEEATPRERRARYEGGPDEAVPTSPRARPEDSADRPPSQVRTALVHAPARPALGDPDAMQAPDTEVYPRRRSTVRVAIALAVVVAAGAIAVAIVLAIRPSDDGPRATAITPDAAPALDAAAAASITGDAADDDLIEMPADPARPRKKTGLLSIDSTPYATIYIDGTSLGVTPIVKRSVLAGRHKLRAILEDGRTREVNIDIPAGRLAPPISLTDW